MMKILKLTSWVLLSVLFMGISGNFLEIYCDRLVTAIMWPDPHGFMDNSFFKLIITNYIYIVEISLISIPLAILNNWVVNNKEVGLKTGFVMSYSIYWVFDYFLLYYYNHLFRYINSRPGAHSDTVVYYDTWWYLVHAVLLCFPLIYSLMVLNYKFINKYDIGKLVSVLLLLLLLHELPYFLIWYGIVLVVYFFFRTKNEVFDRLEGSTLILIFISILLISISRWFIVLPWLIILVNTKCRLKSKLVFIAITYLILPVIVEYLRLDLLDRHLYQVKNIELREIFLDSGVEKYYH